MNNIHKHTDENGNVLILKRINKDRTAYGGFSYPAVGSVVKPTSFDPSTDCGGGLHGWPWSFGLGDGSSFDILNDIWLVLAAKPENVVGNITGGAKCKCSKAVIQFEGSFHEAFTMLQKGLSEYIKTLAAGGRCSILAASEYGSILAASGGYSNLATSGYYSKLAASGNCSILAASGGYSNLAASGNWSTLAASGNNSSLVASGNWSTLAASGNCSTLAASGEYSSLAASGNNSSLAASGNCSNLAASGNWSKLAASGQTSKLAASGKDCVVMAAGSGSTASAGENGCISLTWHDGLRFRVITGYVGEDGIKPNTQYCIENGKLTEVE